MEDFISRLWSGSPSPVYNVSENDCVTKSYTRYRESREAFYDLCDEEQRKAFCEMEKYGSEYTAIKELEIFKEGLKMGKQFAEL